MQTFDVYLNRRLTEIDVIITQLVQRDLFTMFDWLHLDCSMNDIELQKHLEVYASMLLYANIDNLLEKVQEIIKNDMYLDADIDFLKKMIASGESGLVLSASEIDALEESFTGGESYLEITVDALDYYIAHSFGSVEFDMTLSANQLDTFKYDMEKLDEILEFSANIDFSSLKMTDGFDEVLYIDIPSTNIFYMLTAGGQSTTYMCAKPVKEYVLAKVLHDVCSDIYLGATAEKDCELTKFLDIQSSFELIADMAETLIQFISSQSEMQLDCEAGAGLRRYRLLNEMDEFTLADFDDMTLHEVDYVVIAE